MSFIRSLHLTKKSDTFFSNIICPIFVDRSTELIEVSFSHTTKIDYDPKKTYNSMDYIFQQQQQNDMKTKDHEIGYEVCIRFEFTCFLTKENLF